MRILGIESSCDETAAAVVDEHGLVYSDVIASQIAAHAGYGGVVPELAAREHLKHIDPVVAKALEAAGGLANIDAIAVTQGPGLIGALLVGVQYAKTLSYASGLPLIGVDHLHAHLLACDLHLVGENAPSVPRPFIALLASGGHTALYLVKDNIDYALLGQTRDDAAGETFDKAGKLLGLGYPGGPRIDKFAASVPLSDIDRKLFPMPMSQKASLDFSFSGLKSSIARHVEAHGIPLGDELSKMCASIQYVIVETLVRKSLAACQRESVQTLVLAGGVAANQGLRTRVVQLAANAGVQANLPARRFCTDNAAMIAYAGAHLRARAASPLVFEPYSSAIGKVRGKIR